MASATITSLPPLLLLLLLAVAYASGKFTPQQRAE